MAAKKAKKEKPKPPIRFFAGGELFYSGEYDSESGKCETVYHDMEIQNRLEPVLTRRLTEAAKSIVAENPETGLLSI